LTGTSPLFEVELVFLLKIYLRKTLLLCYIVSSYMKLEYDHVTVGRDSLTVSFVITNISNQNESRPGKGTKSAN
jgi:hypothetical protein